MNILKIQKWLCFIGLMAILIGCKSSANKTENEPVSISNTTENKNTPSNSVDDGWGANPRDIALGRDVSGQSDGWYTKKYSGKANERSIELKSPSYMESTCKQSIKKENGKALIESTYNSLSSEIKPEVIAELNSKITPQDLKNIEVSNCKPSGSDNSFSECECYLSFKVDGGKKTIVEKASTVTK